MGQSEKRPILEDENGAEEESNTETAENTEEAVEPPSKKIKQLISPKEFLQRIKQNAEDKKALLSEFKSQCLSDDGDSFLQEYFTIRGSWFDIIPMLEDSSYIPVDLILEVLTLLLYKVMKEYPKGDHDNTNKAIKSFLSNYATTIHKILGPTVEDREKIYLFKLLIAIITYSSSFAKDVISFIPLQYQSLGLLSRFKKYNKAVRQETVRNSFIKFIMAYLMDPQIIILILLRPQIIQSIIIDLKFDVAEVLCYVLKCFKENILENPMVRKSTKIKIFKLIMIKDLINLYNWKGPASYKENPLKAPTKVDKQDKAKVNEAVHQFLIVLCTTQNGIIIPDKNLGINNDFHNYVALTILEKLDKPWLHNRPAELVSKMCSSSPDLVNKLWVLMRPEIEPNDSEEWLKSIRFIQNVISEITPDKFGFLAKDYYPQKYIYVIKEVVANNLLIKAIMPETKFVNIIVKHETLKVIEKIVSRIVLFIKAAEEAYTTEKADDFKKQLSQHLTRSLIPFQLIINDWSKVPVHYEFTIFEHMNLILDIFDGYKIVCPNHLISANKDLALLTEIDKVISEKEESCLLKIKIIKVFLPYEPEFHVSKPTLFGNTFSQILDYYFLKKDELSKNTLIKMFSNTQIFDTAESEIIIWLNGIFNLGNLRITIHKFLLNTLTKTSSNLLEYLKELSEKKKEIDGVGGTGNYKDILDKLRDDNIEEITSKINHNQVSPMILAAFEEIKKSDLRKEDNVELKMYFNFVMINLFHSQTCPKLLISLVEHNKDVVPDEIINYITSWKTGKGSILEEIEGEITIMSLLSASIYLGGGKGFIEDAKELPFNDIKFNMVEMVLFYLTNLSHLKENVYKSCVDIVQAFLDGCEEIVFTNQNLLEKFSPVHAGKSSCLGYCTSFIIEMFKATNINTTSKERYLKPYRSKLQADILAIIKKTSKNSFENINNICDVIGLGYNDSMEILNSIPNINNDDLISKENNFTVVYDIIVNAIKFLSSICNTNYDLAPLKPDIVDALGSKLAYLNERNLDTSLFAQHFTSYLQRFPHSLMDVPKNLFKSIVQKSDYCKENSTLATAIFESSSNSLITLIIENLENLVSKKGLILQLLDSAIKIGVPTDDIEAIYKGFEISILKALEKPQKAGQHFEKYSESVCELIKRYMDFEAYKHYLTKVQKFNVSEIFHAEMLCSIYKKYYCSKDVDEQNIVNSLLTFIHLIVNLFKRKTKSIDDWNKIKKISTILNNLFFELNDINLDSIKNNETFNVFYKFSLKYGIGENEYLLAILTSFFKHMKLNQEDADMTMEMMTSHSEFVNILLSKNEEQKIEILKLLLIMYKSFPSVMRNEHVPILLSSYNATCSTADRINLEILQLFEANPSQSNFYNYKPYLWGVAASNHYTVAKDAKKTLWKQPRTKDVLDILTIPCVMKTIAHYNASTKFTFPFSDNNSAEDKTMYDLAFMLPLFGHLLATENKISTFAFAKSGALSLTIRALSSTNVETRRAVWHILSRYYAQLEVDGNRDYALWSKFIVFVCKGTTRINTWILNNVAAVFLARMALVLTNPLDSMYTPLSSFLMAKQVPNLDTIPEFKIILNSSSVDFKDHKLFIFEVLRDSLRAPCDLHLCTKDAAFNLLMENYNSVVSDNDLKSIILDIFKNTLLLKKGPFTLCKEYSFLSWLNNVISTEKSPILISKIINLLDIISEAMVKTNGMIIIGFMVTEILDKFMDATLDEHTVISLIKVLTYLCEFGGVDVVSEEKLKKVVKHVNSRVCMYMIDFRHKMKCELKEEDGVNYYIHKLTNLWIEKL